MKKILSTFIIGMALCFSCAFFVFAAGNGYVSGSTITYSITDVPEGNLRSFSVYLLTSNAHIKCYKDAAARTPEARNGSAVNRYNITSPINKGSASSKNALKITAPNGSVIKSAEKVTFTYTYVGGSLAATVSIENPSSSLTGIAIVGRDGSGHYYPVGGGDGTIDISALVKQAARNAAGPGGGSGSSGSGGGSGSGGSGGSGSGTGSGTDTSGKAGPGGNGSGDGNTGSGSSSSASGSTGDGSGGGSGNGQGVGSGTGAGDDDDGSGDHAQDIIDIRDNISDITSPSNPSDHKDKGAQDKKPPCVLRRMWG